MKIDRLQYVLLEKRYSWAIHLAIEYCTSWIHLVYLKNFDTMTETYTFCTTNTSSLKIAIDPFSVCHLNANKANYSEAFSNIIFQTQWFGKCLFPMHSIFWFEFSIEYRIYPAKKTHFIPSKLVNFPKIPQLFRLTLTGIRLLEFRLYQMVNLKR